MKKVLVTGLGGFIGRYCVPLLLQQGFEIHGISRSQKSDLVANINWHKLDLLDSKAVLKCIKEIQPTHLLNLAWYTEHGKYWQSTENIKWVQASLNLLTAFAENGGQRFVGAGSCAEYDWRYGLLSEDLTPRVSQTPFGQFKNALYDASNAYALLRKLSFAWGRVFFVYGPHEPTSKLITSVMSSLLSDQTVNCSQGYQLRDFIYVRDVAKIFVALLDSDIQGAVNIGSGYPISVREVVKMIAKKINKPELIQFGKLTSTETEYPLVLADIQKFKQLGVSLQFDIQAGIVNMLEFHQQKVL